MGVRKILSTQYTTFWTRLFSREAQLMIVSEQEGAEIFVNGESTGKFTPALLTVSQGSELTITLKLTAHQNYTKTIGVGSVLSFHYCTLQREAWRVYEEDDSNWVYLPQAR